MRVHKMIVGWLLLAFVSVTEAQQSPAATTRPAGASAPYAPYARFVPAVESLGTIPESTRQMSEKLLKLPPMEALAMLRDEAGKYHERKGTTDITMLGDMAGHYAKYERLISAKGIGRVCYTGASKEKAAMGWSWDYGTDIQVYWGEPDKMRVERGGGAPGFTCEGQAFPAAVGGNWPEWRDAWRDGDTLIAANWHGATEYVWVDLKTLTVLTKVWLAGREGGGRVFVTRVHGYRYQDGWPFPIPTRGTQELYRNMDALEPYETYTYELDVVLEKEPRKDFVIPAPPFEPPPRPKNK